jgi:predicted dehydrogenase
VKVNYRKSYLIAKVKNMEKVKFGVIGVKGIGKTHMDSIVSSKNAKLTAVADINEAEGRTAALKYGVEWYRDYEKMLEQKNLDAVSICTPHFLHCPMALKALEYGKNVLVEKPMAITVREADGMVEKARKTGLKLGVVFQYRTFPIYREIKRLIDSDEIGKIYRACMEACVLRTQTYYESDSWRGKWKTEGGGALINQTIHNIDLL